MEPMPEDARYGGTEAWVATPGWTVELISPEGFRTLDVVAVRLVVCMGGASLVVDEVKVIDGGQEYLLADDAFGAVLRYVAA